MAKNDNIIDFLGDVADAIREKKETTDPIAAQNFADEIRGIETDGMRYFDVRGFDHRNNWEPIAKSCSFVKSYLNSQWMITTPGLHWGYSWGDYNVGAIAVDDREVTDPSNGEIIRPIEILGETTYPEITKEEFYDLTWEALEQPAG